MGIAISFGFSYSPRILDWFISSFGWQGAWQMLGIAVGAVFMIFALITFRDNPEDYGFIPDGKLIEVKSKNAPIYHPENDYTLKEARATYSFWIFNLSLTLYVLYATAFTFHIVDIFSQSGISRADAIAIFLPASVVALIFQIGSGYISDYIQLKHLLLIQLTGLIIASVGFAFLKEGLPVYLIILGNGIAGGIFGVLSSVTWPRFFGTKHLGEISGFNMSCIVFGSAIGPYLFSLFNNTFSGYFTAGMFCLSAGAVLFILALKADNVNRMRL
jgi:sugar phosphate permease